MNHIEVEKRKPLTSRQRVALFDEHKGICALCGLKIQASEKWRDEHLRALGLLGTNEWDNRAPVHVHCALAKDKRDIPRIAKAKRQRRKHLGIGKSGPPMPGTRRSAFKKKFTGQVEFRK